VKGITLTVTLQIRMLQRRESRAVVYCVAVVDKTRNLALYAVNAVAFLVKTISLYFAQVSLSKLSFSDI
jgi:hypothetical protein